jgi:MFS transporter, UMF1 family
MSDNGVPKKSTNKKIPVAANSLAVGVVGTALDDDREVPRKQVVSWALWDWATQPFNSVILTFVFTALYLTTDSFLPADIAALGEESDAYQRGIASLSSTYGYVLGAAGILVALLAPVIGQQSDASGRRKRWLLIGTAVMTLCTAALFFVEEGPSFFLLGVWLIAVGSVASEIAGVNYNAMLAQVSTRKTVGRISGLGWGLGYLGGIVALIIVVVVTKLDWFGMDTSNGMAFRVIAVGCAIWTIIFVIPIILNVPENTPAPGRERVNFFAAYVVLVKDIIRLFRESRQTFWFLIAAAIYRDGLAGVFAFGAIIAAGTFRFESDEVLIFGIVANLVAGISTIIAGRFDDIFGPRAVILFSLVGLVVAGTATFVLHDSGKAVFWVAGLLLCVFVGPAQAASRSLLTRVTPLGREGEIFGLYATTGRVASFMSPIAWATFIAIGGYQYWGVLGIVAVIAVGLVFMLFVKVAPGARTKS